MELNPYSVRIKRGQDESQREKDILSDFLMNKKRKYYECVIYDLLFYVSDLGALEYIL